MVSSFVQTVLDVELNKYEVAERIQYHRLQADNMIFNTMIERIKRNRSSGLKDEHFVYSLWDELGFETRSIFRTYIKNNYGFTTIQDFVNKFQHHLN